MRSAVKYDYQFSTNLVWTSKYVVPRAQLDTANALPG